MNALEILQKQFGFDHFLPGQQEMIDVILAGKDALSVMPTGSGKSLIYQVPALMFEGLTIVVSPLIALMKDQVESLRINGINAAFINSLLTQSETDQIIEKAKKNEIDLLYMAPEKLLSDQFQKVLKDLHISLLAIDEAHCISTWGHDFRPEYSKLALLKEIFPNVPMLALTATADRITREDIAGQLNLQNPVVHLASFDRPNLNLKVLPGVNRFERIVDFIQERKESAGIIYCLSRRSTEELSEKLNASGIMAGHYHAGMERKARESAQDDFIKDDINVICATIAFGMGIDKSNVRWIIHYNLPKSMENYYQEIGRAGRDGLPSDTLLFYSFRDVVQLREFAENSGQPEIQLEKLHRMQQYAEATSCRRNVLLSYFNEHLEKPCGNCDICKHPPNSFEGTTIAQKALSAIIRMNQNVSSGMLIDVLRGSGKKELIESGYQKIKTYGAGRDIPYFEWQQYLLQFLHQGLFDIDYKDNRKLKITPIGKKVLFDGKKINLVRPALYRSNEKSIPTKVKKRTKAEQMKLDLTAIIKAWRKKSAAQENVPPYVIFNDRTLDEIVEKRPVFKKELTGVSGISEIKSEKYGKELLSLIFEFKIERKDKGSSYLYSKKLLDEGNTINDIALSRNLNVLTIMEHLIKYFENDPGFPILDHLPPFDPDPIIDFITNYSTIQGEHPTNKTTFEHFRGKYEYHQIRIAQLLQNNR